jgi:hypothetical protein
MKLRMKLAAAFAAAGLAAGLSLAGTGSAWADSIPPAGQWKGIFNPYLHAKSNTLCFEAAAAVVFNGSPAQLNECHQYNADGTHQRWIFVPATVPTTGVPVIIVGHPVFLLENVAGGCLKAPSLQLEASLVLTNCNTSDSSTWWAERTPGGTSSPDFQLVVYGYSFCLAASDFRDNAPSRLELATCAGTDTRQLWNLG